MRRISEAPWGDYESYKRRLEENTEKINEIIDWINEREKKERGE